MTDFEKRLRSVLDGIELTDQEERYIRWLAGWDQETVETFAGLFEKCRADRPVGHWIWYEVSGGRKRCKCSECGEPHGSMETRCCPNCGVRMEERSCRNCRHVCIDDNGGWRDEPCGCEKWEAKK